MQPAPPDAFLSYSSRDRRAADRLQKELERLSPAVLGRSQLTIFRDRTDLAAESDLSDRIAGSIRDSRAFLLLLTPNTRSSRWVPLELGFNSSLKEPKKVLVAYQGGSWEELSVDFPEIAGALGIRIFSRDDPFWPERIGAALCGIPPDQLIERARRDRRRRRNIVLAAVAGFIALLLSLTSRIEVRKELITSADPTLVTELVMRNSRVDIIYNPGDNLNFPSETAFEFVKWRGKPPRPLGIPKTNYKESECVVDSGESTALLMTLNRKASLTGIRQTRNRALPADPVLRSLDFPPIHLSPLMSFDSDDLPDAMQDSAGNLWIIVDGNWTIGLPASSDGAGGRSVVQGDFHERQWMICTGNGLERWDGRSDAPEVVVPGTPLNSAGSSLIANGKAFWVNSGPSDQETGLSDTSVEIVDLSTLRKTRADNPMELYPEQGGVHTRDNFFWKLGIGHGSELLTGLSRSNRASVWNTTTGKLVLHATDQNYTGLTASNISPDGRYLVLAEWNGRVSYYRAVLIVAGFDLIDLPLRMAHSANGLHIR